MQDMSGGDPLIIAAGYPTDMDRFLAANEGLARRFGHAFDFPDFSAAELACMFLLKAHERGFALGGGVDANCVAALIERHTDGEWRARHNGGVAERLSRGAMQAQDARLDPTAMKLEEYRKLAATLELCDVTLAAERLME